MPQVCPKRGSPHAWPAPAGHDPGMATLQYESRENMGRKFWTARNGRYAIRIDAKQPGVYPWLITPGGPLSPHGLASNPAEAAGAVSNALDELPR
jgi:hypothetical protein